MAGVVRDSALIGRLGIQSTWIRYGVRPVTQGYLRFGARRWKVALALLLVVVLSAATRPGVTGQQTSAWKVVERLPNRLWKRPQVDVPPITTSQPAILTSIAFLDDLHGWSVGEGGTILRTTDGGRTWKTVVLKDDPELESVFFRTVQEGWATGSLQGQAVIYRTGDGGRTWRLEKKVVDFVPSSITRIWFANQDDGWAVGVGEQEGERYGLVFHTDDGGNHWNVRYSEKGTAMFVDAHFLDERNIWIVSADRVLRTKDGGQHWDIEHLPAQDPKDIFFELDFTSPVDGWVVGGMYTGQVLHTRDGGESWIAMPLPPDSHPYYISCVRFRSASEGWVGATEGVILSTTNGGQSWTVEHTGNVEAIRNLALTSRAIFAVGTEGVILKRSL
jgi:photosystem II stability/assembly factor-like uncharacterized protein